MICEVNYYESGEVKKILIDWNLRDYYDNIRAKYCILSIKFITCIHITDATIQPEKTT